MNDFRRVNLRRPVHVCPKRVSMWRYALGHVAQLVGLFLAFVLVLAGSLGIFLIVTAMAR